MLKSSLSVIILTYNEEAHIARAIASVREIADDIVVVDSYSTDRTVERGKALGATILQNPFVNQAQQFRWALEHANIASEWVMRLDADEYIEPDLAARLASELPAMRPEVTGVNLKRKHIFMGRWIRHGGRYPLLLLRIWRNGTARVEDRWMDEHIFLTEGHAVTFSGGFVDHNLNDLTSFIEKHNRYATREAVEVISRRYGLRAPDSATLSNTSVQTVAKRIIYATIFSTLQFGLSSTLYFLYRYFVRLGFLDGIEGMIYHFLQGFWYRFLVGAKIVELERQLPRGSDEDAMREKLFVLTGCRL